MARHPDWKLNVYGLGFFRFNLELSAISATDGSLKLEHPFSSWYFIPKRNSTMSKSIDEPSAQSEADEIHRLQAAIDQSNLRRAAQLSMAEKLKLGADLYDDGIRWLKRIIKAEHPNLNDEQVSQELDRRKAIQRRVEEAGLFRPYEEDTLSEEV